MTRIENKRKKHAPQNPLEFKLRTPSPRNSHTEIAPFRKGLLPACPRLFRRGTPQSALPGDAPLRITPHAP
ncbi:hypothetical protein CE91St16_12690 [Alistipes finegoldii]|uniref:Uncharacterized protein n=1 Tax=Alistipes finegoldii TaxID=214856 RepID=A0AA37KU81_9BACT|nr:hypothetical protein [Alistipes finegoldii]BDF64863.1 hypothetical protein CE91St15_23490 [Alistipes finegoldii]GKI18361.1 hypothetical protein CE91St16_12690 [Alistipes finegoldii]